MNVVAFLIRQFVVFYLKLFSHLIGSQFPNLCCASLTVIYLLCLSKQSKLINLQHFKSDVIGEDVCNKIKWKTLHRINWTLIPK